MGKVRILHVLGKSPIGGVGTFLKNINQNIDLSNVSFDYLICTNNNKGEFEEFTKNLGSQIFLLPELKYKNLLRYLRELVNFYKYYACNYDIVHIHTPNIALINLLAAIKYKIMIRIVHSHSIKYSDRKLRSIRNFVLQIPVNSLATNYVACSEASAKFLFRKQYQKNSVKIIKNTIVIEDFKYNEIVRMKIRKELNIEDAFVVGHVGAFLTVKNHMYLLEIFKNIYSKNRSSILLLVGDGDLRENICLKVKEYGMEKNVIFMGRLSNVNEIMQAFDVFILPSLFEGFPLVGLEAQAAGLPCIFSDTITKEIGLTESASFLSLNLNPKKWAEITIKLMEIMNRENNSKRVEELGYDISSECKEIEKYYVDLRYTLKGK